MFTVRIMSAGRQVSFFEGSYDACMALVHAVEAFPQYYVYVEVYETESCETKYKKTSEFWA